MRSFFRCVFFLSFSFSLSHLMLALCFPFSLVALILTLSAELENIGFSLAQHPHIVWHTEQLEKETNIHTLYSQWNLMACSVFIMMIIVINIGAMLIVLPQFFRNGFMFHFLFLFFQCTQIELSSARIFYSTLLTLMLKSRQHHWNWQRKLRFFLRAKKHWTKPTI